MKALFLAAALLAPSARGAQPKSLGRLDILSVCQDADAKTFRAWTLPEAVEHMRACLGKVYAKTPGAAVARAGKTRGAKALVIELVPPLTDADAGVLRAAIGTRRGKLYGFPAVVVTQQAEKK